MYIINYVKRKELNLCNSRQFPRLPLPLHVQTKAKKTRKRNEIQTKYATNYSATDKTINQICEPKSLLVYYQPAHLLAGESTDRAESCWDGTDG